MSKEFFAGFHQHVPSKIFSSGARELLHEYRMKAPERELEVVLCMDHFGTLDLSPLDFSFKLLPKWQQNEYDVWFEESAFTC